MSICRWSSTSRESCSVIPPGRICRLSSFGRRGPTAGRDLSSRHEGPVTWACLIPVAAVARSVGGGRTGYGAHRALLHLQGGPVSTRRAAGRVGLGRRVAAAEYPDLAVVGAGLRGEVLDTLGEHRGQP